MTARPQHCTRGRPRAWRLVHAALGVLVAFAATAACAHDAFEITTTARWRSAALVLEITAARSTASRMAGREESFAPEQFEEHRARLAASAREFFEITAGDRPLAARSSQAALGVENDVDYVVTFPLPPPGPVRFFARHVSRLGQGYGDVLTVHAADGALLGQKLLIGDDLSLSVDVPAQSAATAAATRPHRFRPGLAALSIGVIVTTALCLRRRRKAGPG